LNNDFENPYKLNSALSNMDVDLDTTQLRRSADSLIAADWHEPTIFTLEQSRLISPKHMIEYLVTD
jgi:hypothetical protein